MTAIYQSNGELTDSIPDEHVAKAQAYLTDDDMTQYLDPPLADVVVRITWNLHADGHAYHVEAITERPLTDDELKALASWTSGQNSDGLGESFEQQDWAWISDDDCSDPWCDEDHYDDGHMCSFDWETNDSTFTRVV